MENKGPKYKAFVTPVGTAVFPWLTKADTEHDKNGIYHVDVCVPFEQAQPLIAKLEGILADFIGTLPLAKQQAYKARQVFIEELTRPTYPENSTAEQRKAIRDNFIGEPTGNVLFRCKCKAVFQGADGELIKQAPVVVDAATGERIEGPVYGGSTIKVKGQVIPYTNAATSLVGLSLRLKAVQVHDLVTGSGGDGFWTDFDTNC